MPSRRKFGIALGAAALTPMLWENAVAEVRESGTVSTEIIHALLDAQGARGIYGDPDRLEELRHALTDKIRQHVRLRDFPVPDDVGPLPIFNR